MFEKQKTKLNNYNKIVIIFTVLLITNIIFYISLLIVFYKDIINGITNFGLINNIFLIVSAIIILGFISTRLPQFRKGNKGSIYEIGYLILFGMVSIVVSYFNKSTEFDYIVMPLLDMFKVLSVMLILTLIATKTKAFKGVISGKISKKTIIYCFIIFSILGILSSIYYVNVDGTPSDVRNLIIMISGLFGGPYVGIPSGIIAGLFKYSQGGATALPCAVATVICGIIGSLIHVWNNGKFPKTRHSAILMFLFIGFDMLLIVVLTPPYISIAYIRNIYILTVFGSVIGMILFSMILNETKTKNTTINYEDLKLKEMENTLDEYDERIENLEEEIRELKNQNPK